jgi:hypothetical protein
VPTSTKLQEQFGDDVQVIFVECQNTPKDTYEAFAWKMKWMGNGAMWTTERPMATVGNGLPETAVLGIDGAILMPTLSGEPAALIMASRLSTTKRIRLLTLPPYWSVRWFTFVDRNCMGR